MLDSISDNRVDMGSYMSSAFPATSYIDPNPRMIPTVPTASAYYDRPAPRRLRPWIALGSIILACIGAGMIITTFTSWGTIGSLWGVFVAGILLATAALFGLLASATVRPIAAKLFVITLALCWAGAIAVLIVNATSLDGKMNSQCASNNAPRFSPTCEDIRQYHIVVFTVFGVLAAVWTPVLLVAAGYFARTTDVYRKQEYASSQVVAPVGGGGM